MPEYIEQPTTFTSPDYHPLDVMAEETANKLLQANLFHLDSHEWEAKPVFYVQLSEVGSDLQHYPGQLEQKKLVTSRVVEGMYKELGGTGRVAESYKKNTTISVYECKDKEWGILYLRREITTEPTVQRPRLIVSVTREKPAEFVKYEATERRMTRFKRAANVVINSKHRATKSVDQFLSSDPKKSRYPFTW